MLDDPPLSVLSFLLSAGSGWLSAALFYATTGSLVLLLLLGSALISGSELAFFSLKKDSLNALRSLERRSMRHLISLLRRPEHLLSAILITNNLLNVTIVSLSTFMVWNFYGSSDLKGTLITLLTAFITIIIVLFGEIIPKVYAAQNALKYASFMATPLFYLLWVLRPFTSIFGYIDKKVRQRMQAKGYSYSIDSLHKALDIAMENEAPTGQEHMLRGIMHLSSVAVRDVMQPRHVIKAVDKRAKYSLLFEELKKHHYARLPVYEKHVDKIVGILYVKDVLSYAHQKGGSELSLFRDKRGDNWHKLIRPAYFVPENRKLGALFRDFQKKRVHMAIVVDEYGGTSGLITMEDVVEEIVGDIRDEHEKQAKQQPMHKRISEGVYDFEARIGINDMCKLLELPPTYFDEVRAESQSLAGLVLEVHGKLPSKETELKYKGISLHVISVNRKRIESVRVTLPPDLLTNKQEGISSPPPETPKGS